MKLVLKDIEKSYGGKQVLKEASYTFEKGKIYGLLGRNGAGKTTLFNCISGELKYENGSVSITCDGQNSDELDYKKVGYVFSEPVLPEFLTGYEFLKFYIDINKDKIENLLTIDEYFDIIKIKDEDRYRLMKELINWYNENKDKLHKIHLAAEFHFRYIYIHPFIDGNGRTARLLMNLILMSNGYPITVIKTENRDIYMKALEKASTESDISEFVNIVSEAVDRSLDTYLYIVS
jgi:ABC-type sugar transport system ATPase subunit